MANIEQTSVTKQISELLQGDSVAEETEQEVETDEKGSETPAEQAAPEIDAAETAQEPGPGATDKGHDLAETGEGDGSENVAEGDEQQELNFDGLADRLGVEKAELYAVEIPLGDDGSMTLGQVKDRFSELLTVDDARASIDLDRIDHQKDVMEAHSEIETALNLAAADGMTISPQLLERARQERQAMIHRESEKIRTVLPGWNDPDVLAGDRKLIQETLREYSFNEAEVNQIFDARLLHFAHDAVKALKHMRHARDVTAGLRPLQPGKKPGVKPRKGTDAKKQNLIRKAKEGGKRSDQIAAVSHLISGA